MAGTPPNLSLTPRRSPAEPYQLAEGVLRLSRDLPLSCGETLIRPRLAWRRIGPADAPAVLVLGGISACRQLWQPDGSGWWQELLGPGRVLDPACYQILGLDYLGGSGDSESAAHHDGLFPPISSHDQAEAIAGLLAELGLSRLQSVIGASYGGMVALALAEAHPELLGRALVICAAHEPWPLASGWRHIQRELVAFGQRHGDAETGLKLARGLAVTTYRSGQEFAARFGPGPEGGCPDYLDHHGERFAARFDPQAFLCLSQSIDTHSVRPEAIRLPVDLIGFDSDQIVPPAQLAGLYERLGTPGRYEQITTIYGHDAFLKEFPAVAASIRSHLDAACHSQQQLSLEYAA